MKTDKNRTVAFTGHRSNRIITDAVMLTAEIEKIITDLYFRGYRHFMTGMAEGFDLLSAEAVLKIRNLHTDIKLIAVIPFTGQAKYFSNEDKKRYGIVFQQCDESVLITDRYYKGCFYRRNDYLIDNASFVVAYFDGTPKGGTHYTLNKAKGSELPVINVMDSITANQWWAMLSFDGLEDITGIKQDRDGNNKKDDLFIDACMLFWTKKTGAEKYEIYLKYSKLHKAFDAE